jgi:hypothetical protein
MMCNERLECGIKKLISGLSADAIDRWIRLTSSERVLFCTSLVNVKHISVMAEINMN